MKLKRTSIMTVVWAFFQLIISLGIIYYPAKKIVEKTDNYTIHFAVWLFITLQFLTFFSQIVRWMGFKYGIDEKNFYVKKGILKISRRSVPILKIRQYKQITTWKYRILHMTHIVIDTGINSDEGTIDLNMITRAESKYLKNRLKIAGIEDADSKEVDFFRGHFKIQNQNVKRIYKPAVIDIFTSSISSLQVIIFLFALNSFKGDIEYFSFGNKLEYVFVNYLAPLREDKYYFLAIIFIFLLLIFLGFLREYLVFGNFELLTDDENFYSLEGLLNRNINSFKKNRLKTFAINSNLLMQIFHLNQVEVFTSSPSDFEESKHVILPFIRQKDCSKIFRKEFNYQHYQPVKIRLNYVTVLKVVVLFLSLELVLLFTDLSFKNTMSQYLIWIFLIYFLNLIKNLICTNLQYRDGFINTRSGLFFRKEYLSKVSDIERYYLKQGPIQKLLNTQTIIICFRGAPIKRRRIYMVSKKEFRNLETQFRQRTETELS
ncbi:hypothetical protein EPT61_02730 [Pediococcus pentosaceus]|uniref:PH domain-containing protein n=1 Tax=Pediococcus pentosaceus TaxID=1255 RepID=UPI001008CED4|nr:PH domain-containing protein [Pediococcus pentosaceus]RXI21846.1 hypothetical protein EPT61_02730 [Pediococcus pentosaceus]